MLVHTHHLELHFPTSSNVQLTVHVDAKSSSTAQSYGSEDCLIEPYTYLVDDWNLIDGENEIARAQHVTRWSVWTDALHDTVALTPVTRLFGDERNPKVV